MRQTSGREMSGVSVSIFDRRAGGLKEMRGGAMPFPEEEAFSQRNRTVVAEVLRLEHSW